MNNNFWLKLKNKSRFRNKPGMTAVPILALAPMAGITDSAFRQVCKYYGADVVYTEMVSADGLYYEGKKTLEFLKFSKKERPVVLQLFGKHPERFTKAAQLAEQAGFDGIDINFGCPAKKVAGHGGGVTLMRDLNKCRQIIEAVIAGTKLPVSIKTRTSIKKDEGIVTALDFIKAIEDLPITAIMIHGRPYENPFNAEINYEMIRLAGQEFLKTHPQGVVLGNGGINTPEEAKKMIELTGCDGVGLARALYGRPWLFKQIRDYLSKGKFKEVSEKEIKKNMLRHGKFAFKAKGDQGIVELRKHLLWYVKGWPKARELRAGLVKISNISELKWFIDKGIDKK